MSIAEIATAIERLGRHIDAPYPAKALADALRYEVTVGRVKRAGRGRYVVVALSNGMRSRVLARFGRHASYGINWNQ